MELKENQLSSGQIVLASKDEGHLSPCFFVNWQQSIQKGTGPVVNPMLTYDEYGDFVVVPKVYDLPSNITLSKEHSQAQTGQIVLANKGGYKKGDPRNWVLAFFCKTIKDHILISFRYSKNANILVDSQCCKEIRAIPDYLLALQSA